MSRLVGWLVIGCVTAHQQLMAYADESQEETDNYSDEEDYEHSLSFEEDDI
jgi:hypothetical protein